MKINEKIRQLRETHSLSQEEVADKLGMSIAGYGKIERGEVRTNLARLEQISEAFGIDVVELLAYGEESQISFNHSTNTDSFNNAFFGSSGKNLELEIQRLQLMLSHKDEIIDNLKRENKLLFEMNEILKTNNIQTQN